MNPTHALRERLPPLNSLRVFESAGRLESFNRAGDELHVTPSAVSHQIRSLEQFLGARLFVRQTRQVRLTPQGRDLLSTVQNAFDQIAVATRRIQRADDDGTLTLQVARRKVARAGTAAAGGVPIGGAAAPPGAFFGYSGVD